ncbi:MAG TPA: MFS transporter [Oligoflexus sp.]|uniref:MFS transporter n=1 Tax=Oligoflexus sp. TaxID=1971216 RepID=UPI002D7F81F0|nr:MFS transporter [Oligoflexus sp.]HET9238911.1 MFS transporter [Oligoflexus sp.]
MLPSRRQFTLLLMCGTLPVMTTASLAPILPGLHRAFRDVPQIDVLSRLVLTAPALSIAMGALLAGYLLDRLGRRSVLAVSLMIFALFGSYGLWTQDIQWLIGARFIFGFAVAGIMTATATLLADFFEPKHLRSKMGLQAGIMGGWGIFAQTASGWLAETSWRYPFALFLAALPLLPLVWLWLPETIKVQAEENAVPESKGPISPQAFIIGFFSFAAMGLFVVVPIQAPFYFGHKLGIGPTSTAILLSVLTGASSLTSLSFAFLKGRWTQKTILTLGFLSMTIGFLMLSLWTRRLVLAGGMAAIGCGIGSIGPSISAWIAELTSPSYRGRAMGLLTTANYLGQFSVPLWSQQLLEPYGYEGLFLTAALVSFLCSVSVMLSLRNLRLHAAGTNVDMVVMPAPDSRDKEKDSRLSS